MKKLQISEITQLSSIMHACYFQIILIFMQTVHGLSPPPPIHRLRSVVRDPVTTLLHVVVLDPRYNRSIHYNSYKWLCAIELARV